MIQVARISRVFVALTAVMIAMVTMIFKVKLICNPLTARVDQRGF